MADITRRSLLGTAALGAGAFLISGRAQATLLRGLSLVELSKESDHIVLGTPLELVAHWETLGGRKRIVTDARVRIDDVLGHAAPADGEILVRTLGGTVGDVAALVYGEAQLETNEPSVLFLSALPDAVYRVKGMAQGHYPLRPDTQSVLRLVASPRMPELVGRAPFAVHALAGQDLPHARSLVQQALAQ